MIQVSNCPGYQRNAGEKYTIRLGALFGEAIAEDIAEALSSVIELNVLWSRPEAGGQGYPFATSQSTPANPRISSSGDGVRDGPYMKFRWSQSLCQNYERPKREEGPRGSAGVSVT